MHSCFPKSLIMLPKFVVLIFFCLKPFTPCDAQGSKDHLKAIILTLKSLTNSVNDENKDFGAQLDICDTKFTKIEVINQRLMKESAGLTRTSFSLIKSSKKTDKTASINSQGLQEQLIPYYMRLGELLVKMEKRLKSGQNCFNELTEIHNRRIKNADSRKDGEASFATIDNNINHIRAELQEISSNAQHQRDLYKLSAGRIFLSKK